MDSNINRTDFTALETIAMILKQLSKSQEVDLCDSEWCINMIRHEVEQTGRQIWNCPRGTQNPLEVPYDY